MKQSDQDLMDGVVRREEAAFEALVTLYGEDLKRQLIRMVRDEATTHDLLQEVFVKVWERAEQWEGTGSLRSYLYRIATNQALNHLQMLRRRSEQALEPPVDRGDKDDGDEKITPHWLVDPHARPDLDAEQAEHTQLLRNAIAALPPERQTVFFMAHIDDRSMADIADTLGIAEGTVKSRLHYTMKMLTTYWKELDQEGYQP